MFISIIISTVVAVWLLGRLQDRAYRLEEAARLYAVAGERLNALSSDLELIDVDRQYLRMYAKHANAMIRRHDRCIEKGKPKEVKACANEMHAFCRHWENYLDANQSQLH